MGREGGRGVEGRGGEARRGEGGMTVIHIIIGIYRDVWIAAIA